MMGRKNKKLMVFFALVALTGLFALPVFAQTPDLGLNIVGENIALGGGDIRVTIAKILNAGFGFLGVAMLAIVVYSGFLYMTSGGDPQKTAKARKWLTNSVIGLVIILSAFAITNFVLRSLNEAVNRSGGQTTTTGGPLGEIGGSGSVFRVLSVTPQGDHAPDGWPRCSRVNSIFSASLDANLVGENISVKKKVAGAADEAV
ncbi:MAG: pilin, partial [Patescibacteria group bacterium]